MTEAYIIDAVRTPIGRGKATGARARLHGVDMLAQTTIRRFERTGVDPGVVDDLLIRCVNRVGEQTGNIGRQAWLAAGYPEPFPSSTIERMCGSSKQALHFGAQADLPGTQDVVSSLASSR
jgi:acetyl-CoA acetyltransferase